MKTRRVVSVIVLVALVGIGGVVIRYYLLRMQNDLKVINCTAESIPLIHIEVDDNRVIELRDLSSFDEVVVGLPSGGWHRFRIVVWHSNGTISQSNFGGTPGSIRGTSWHIMVLPLDSEMKFTISGVGR